jgi:hypothetical protein
MLTVRRVQSARLEAAHHKIVVQVPARIKDYLFSKVSRPNLGAKLLSPMRTGDTFTGRKAVGEGEGIDNSSSSSADDDNVWSYTSTPDIH